MLNNQDFTHNRTDFLGGSDIGAILGVSKYRSAMDVWLEKTGKKSIAKTVLPCALVRLRSPSLPMNMPYSQESIYLNIHRV